MHVLVTRPRSDAQDMCAALEAAGHQVSVEPLLEIELAPVGSALLTDVQALVLTSRNALRALSASPALYDARRLPVFAVGPGTATLARQAGFGTVFAGEGTARDLADLIANHRRPEDGVLLHLAGEILAFDLKGDLEARGYTVSQTTVYRAVASQSLSESVVHALAALSIDAVMLMSPRTAAVYADLVARHELAEAARTPIYLCLSLAVASALAPLAPHRIAVADQPSSQEMLALVARIAAELR